MVHTALSLFLSFFQILLASVDKYKQNLLASEIKTLIFNFLTKNSKKSCIFMIRKIRVPNVPFHFFDKLKYEIRNKDLIFISILKLRYKT